MTTTTLSNGTTLTNGTILAGNTDIVLDNQAVYLAGTTLNDAGTLSLASGGDGTALIIDSPTVNLTGGGFIILSDNPGNQIYGAGTGTDVLINSDTIEGAGNIGVNNGNIPLALTNASKGVIDATGNNALVLQPGGPSILNAGLIEATGAGGLVITNGAVVKQTGGTILASGAGHNVYLENSADVIGGVLRGTGGGLIDVASSSTLDGSAGAITIAAATTVQLNDNQALYLLGNIDNLGTISIASVGDGTALVIDSTAVTLNGGGIVTLSNNGGNQIYGTGSGTDTLINFNNTIEGGGNIGINSGNDPLALTNDAAGVIDANAANAALVIQTGGPSVMNDGLIEATSTAGLVITNSTVIDQTGGGKLLASGAGDNIYFENSAEILGGSLRGTLGGSFVVAGGGAIFGGPSTAAAITIAAATTVLIDDNQALNLYGTIDNIGTIAFSSQGDFTGLALDSGTVVLTGGGVIAFDATGADAIYGANSTLDTLINLNNTIEGGGRLGLNSGNNPLALTNDSVINANQSGAMTIQSGGPVLINNDLIEATGSGGLLVYSTTINNAAGTVAAAGGNVYLQNGADIVGGKLTGSGGGIFVDIGGGDTLDGSISGLSIAAGATVQVNDNQALYVLGSIAGGGTLALASGGDSTEVIIDSPTVVLSGGVLSMSDNAANQIYSVGAGAETLINNETIEGAGQLGVNNGNIPLALTNNGLIDATGANALVIQPGGPALINAGLMEATNTGGLVITNGATVDQTGGTILASGTGDNVYLQSGADIVGGVLLGTGGGSFIVGGGGGTLDGSTGALTIGLATTVQVQDNQQLIVLGNLDNLGTIFLNSGGDSTNLILESATVSLTGGGTLLLSDNPANRIYGASPTDATLINVNNTIEGAGQLGVNNSNVPLALTNQAAGVIDATGLNALVIQPGGPALINYGLIEATNTGGVVINSTTIQQTGGTILASGSGDNVVLQNGGDIAGGLLLGTGGGSFVIGGGSGTLDGSSVLTIGTLTTVGVNDNQQLQLLGTINNLGTIALNSVGDNTDLLLASATVSLTGGGVVVLSNTGADRIYGSSTLINVNNTIEGAGQIGVNNSNYPVALFNSGVIDADDSNALYIQLGGPSATNSGLLEATAGGTLIFNSTNLTNTATGTLAAFDGSTVLFQNGSSLLNEAAGTLTGGTYEAVAVTSSSNLEITGSGPLLVDAANIVLSGTLSEISFYNSSTNSYATVESSLTEVTGVGTLQIDAGHDYATTNTLTVDAKGHLDLAAGTLAATGLVNAGTIFGNGTIASGLTNTGRIEANGGKLTVAGSIGGAGSIVIDGGASFELGTTTSEAIVFGGAAATLILDKPAAYTGTLTSFAAGDTIDLVGTLASSATITGGRLVASLTSGGTLSFSETAAAAPARLVTTSDGHGGTDITLFNEAAAGTISPTPVNFGQQHAGATLSETYTIANTAPVSPYSENLNATAGATSGSVTDSGSFTGLKPGTTSSSALHATLATSTAGLVSGTATINLYTSGMGVTGDGLGTLAIGTETLAESATIFNYATASAVAPVNFGQGHVGATLSQFIVLDNTAAPGIYSENLDAKFSGTSAGVTGSGSVSELAAGGTSSTGLALSLTSGAAGVESGTATIALTSDGAGIDTLGTTALPSETVAASGTLFNLATASTVAPVNFGIVHVGQTATHTVTLSNNAAPGVYSENLDGSFSGTSTGFTASGSVSELAAGSASSALAVQLSTAKAGTFSGTSTLGLVSDGSGIDSLGTTTLGSELVSLTGTVNNFATLGVSLISGPGKLSESGTTLTLNLGSVAKGATAPAESIGILNNAKGPADLLSGSLSLSGSTSSFIDNSATTFSGIGAGSVSTGHTVSLKTGNVGTFSETITVHASGSNASGYSGALTTDTFIVIGTVTSAAAIADTAAVPAAGNAMSFLAPSAAAAAPQSGTLTGAAAWTQLPALQSGALGGPGLLASTAPAAPPLTIAPAGVVSQFLAGDTLQAAAPLAHVTAPLHWMG